MSNIEKNDNNDNQAERQEIIKPELGKKNIQAIFQELEIMAMQKGEHSSSLDLSKLDKEQIDKVLETMAENEKNAFTFHTKRLDAIKEIELRKIDASVINQKTLRIILFGILILILPTITILILFFKETFFIPWLTFLTGTLGGFGLSKITSNIFKVQDSKNPINEEDNNK